MSNEAARSRTAELDKESLEIVRDILNLLNKKIITRHRDGQLNAGDATYLASAALSRAAAVVNISQLPLDHLDQADKLILGFCKLFAMDAQEQLEILHKKKEAEKLTPPAKSAWDIH